MLADVTHALRLISIARAFARHDALFVFDLAPTPPFLKSVVTTASRTLPGWRPAW